MNIGLLIYGSLDTISGGYLYDRKLVAYLKEQGDQVEILSLPWRNYPRHLLDNFSSSLRGRLRALDVDVLIQDELNHPSLAWLNAAFQTPYPIVSLVHHLRCYETRSTWKNAIYRRVEGRYLDSVDGFIFNSQTTLEAVEEISALKRRPWVIATPAGDRFDPHIEAAEIEARAWQDGPLRLLFVGNLIPRKGLHNVIGALSHLESGMCTLDVVGGYDSDPRYTHHIFQQVHDSGLQEDIRFHGSQVDDALAKLIHAGQVLVVPSTYEGFGIVYLEGMGFGLPAIGTNSGAAKEIITHDESGYLIQPGDEAGLATILEDLYLARGKLTSLGIAARSRYMQFPGWQVSMERIRSFLYEMISL